jgi:epoxyqueuosine reductase QueG
VSLQAGGAASVRPEFRPDPRLVSLQPAELAALSGRSFRKQYGFSSLTRATQAGLVRNWIALLAERGDRRLPPEADGPLRRFPLAGAQWW